MHDDDDYEVDYFDDKGYYDEGMEMRMIVKILMMIMIQWGRW